MLSTAVNNQALININTSDFSAGVYFIVIQNEETIYSKQFIKQ
ncbi:MAG: T9SS type A sorting domain-containing protein [Bacteroidetes bacterium]|nr:T9SS type A sorting domain-containing protein [Bacteroidota bacterium]